MTRLLIALTFALGFAAPASALSFQVQLPTLTFPPKPAPQVSQGCVDHATLGREACTNPAK